jgi:hypothetical protein
LAGIFGIIDYSKSLDVMKRAEQLCATAKQGFEMPSSFHRFTNGAIGYACPPHYSDTRWPLISRDRRYALSVLGEIILPNGIPLDSNNFDEDFLRPFLLTKGDFLSKLRGGFNLALMNEEECIVANDPCGNFMLYYAENKDSFAFSNQMMALSSERCFDQRGVWEHLGVSQSLGGRTILKGIQRVTRGTLLVFNKNGLKCEEYITRSFFPTNEFKTALEEVYNALEISIVQACSSGNITAALSGGFDSRMTWSIILSKGLQSHVTAYTHGLPNSRDMLIAKKMAHSLGLQQDCQLFDNGALSEMPKMWRDFIAMTEGQFSLSQIHSLYAARHIAGRYSIIIDSYGGPMYRRQIKKYVEPSIDANKELVPQIIKYELTPLATSDLLRRDVQEEIRRTVLDSLREYYSTIEHIDNIGDKFDLFYADQTAALRDSVLNNLQLNYTGMRQPLMDCRALTAVSRIPGAFRRREGIHKYIIHRSFPKLERFAMDYSGYPAPYYGYSILRYLPVAFDRVIKKASGVIPFLSSVSLRRPPMDIRSILQPRLTIAKEILLTSHSFYEGLIDRTALEKAIGELESGNFERGQTITQLLTFKLFLDHFF